MARLTRFPGRTRQVRRTHKPVTCCRCGWVWAPYRRIRPARCANQSCRSAYWDRPRREPKEEGPL